MAELLKTWKKNQTALFVDINKPGASETPDWARIGKSTIFDLTFNGETESYDFIDQAIPTEILKSYAPKISQELRTVRGDKAFDAMFELTYNMPTGEEAQRGALFIFPAIYAKAAEGDPEKLFAWYVPAGIVLTNFNPVDEKILFDLNFAGDIIRGNASSVDGAPVFTPFPDQTAWVSTADAV